MEVIDSRYENFKFALADVIADNSSSSGFVVGSWNDPHQDISNLGVILEIDGEVVEVGSSAAILGHPLRSLVAAARMVSEGGERIERSEEHTSELQSLMRISYAVFCLKKKKK